MSEIPHPYPIDHALIVEAQSYKTGADVHDINKHLSEYEYEIQRYDADPVKNRRSYYNAIDAERSLRGLVAEAKSGRVRVLRRSYDD